MGSKCGWDGVVLIRSDVLGRVLTRSDVLGGVLISPVIGYGCVGCGF